MCLTYPKVMLRIEPLILPDFSSNNRLKDSVYPQVSLTISDVLGISLSPSPLPSSLHKHTNIEQWKSDRSLQGYTIECIKITASGRCR